MRVNHAVQNFIYKNFPWTSIIYVRRRYGFEWRWLIKTWRESTGGQERHFVGGYTNKTEDFFSRCIDRDSEECVTYSCIYGTCAVIWHPKRGNTGGWGRPGCLCDNMEDPRDLERGPIK